MKFLNSLWLRSHSGYTRLSKESSFFQNNKLQYFLALFGKYFCLSTFYAPYALLPVTLLYMNNAGVLPSFVYILVISLLCLGVLYQAQDMLLYHPSMPDTARIYVAAPPSFLPYEEVNFVSGDKTNIHGYFLKQAADRLSDAPTLIYFHGNAGNASSPSVLPLYLGCGANILMIDYRGFGRSSGIPSEEGLYLDGEAAVHYLHSRSDINLNKLVLYGHSLGGAVAIHIASKSQWVKGRISAVIVENTFTSIPTTACHMFSSILPFLPFMPKVFFKNQYESVAKVSGIKVPILFIYGDSDEIVPPNMARDLYEAAGNPRSAVVEIPGGSHNDTWCVSHQYQLSIGSFLQKVFERTTIAGHAWHTPETTEERTALSYEWQGHVNGS